ncbi:MAG: transposase [Dehalococcoidia bacterium]
MPRKIDPLGRMAMRPNDIMRSMRYDPFTHNRRSIRLPGYDYTAAGSYFVTINATRAHGLLFGTVVDGEVVLNEYGVFVRDEWERSARIRPELELGAYVVMPNHLHGIVTLVGDRFVGAHGHAPLHAPSLHRPPRSIGAFVARFKGAVTRRINALRETEGTPVWQRNYYEHVVRDDEDLSRIRAYIEDNPRNWEDDEYYR